jgi:hypothetical protein
VSGGISISGDSECVQFSLVKGLQAMVQLRSQRILHLAVEGGAAYIRGKKATDGTWFFFYRTCSGGFDLSESGNELVPATCNQSKTFASVAEALEALANGTEWVLYSPTEVHPDFREEIWNLRQECLSRSESSDGHFNQHITETWLHHLQLENGAVTKSGRRFSD